MLTKIGHQSRLPGSGRAEFQLDYVSRVASKMPVVRQTTRYRDRRCNDPAYEEILCETIGGNGADKPS
jgi:hypothetical protein